MLSKKMVNLKGSTEMKITDLAGQKVGLCVSGGLDSRTLALRLKAAGVRVSAFVADLAQPDVPDIFAVIDKMAPTGVNTTVVDLKNEMADACIDAIMAQATYDGGYWNTTGLARAVTVKGLVTAMQECGCTVLAHGATGRGNDQIRFERYTRSLAPEMKVYAPWRDPNLLSEFPGRSQMADYLVAAGLEPGTQATKRYSTDANLAGLSHEAEDLESLTTGCEIVTPLMGVWPQDAPDRVESVEIRFVSGRPVAINGEILPPLQLMQRANKIAGANGIWMRNALENRIIGTKSRGVYEAPGMMLLGEALDTIYQATMDKYVRRLFLTLSRVVADAIYDGRYFDPVCQGAMAGIETFAKFATGTVTVALYKGTMAFRSLVDCPASLYNPSDSSMEASDGLNPVSAQGFAEIQAIEAVGLARAGQIRIHD